MAGRFGTKVGNFIDWLGSSPAEEQELKARQDELNRRKAGLGALSSVNEKVGERRADAETMAALSKISLGGIEAGDTRPRVGSPNILSPKPMTQLKDTPQGRDILTDRQESEDLSKKSTFDLASEAGLTGEYSNIPEVQNYMKYQKEEEDGIESTKLREEIDMLLPVIGEQMGTNSATYKVLSQLKDPGLLRDIARRGVGNMLDVEESLKRDKERIPIGVEKIQQETSAKAQQAAQTASASTAAKITSEDATKRGLPGTYKPTQYEAASYAKRMEDAETALDSLASVGFNPETFRNALMSKDILNTIKDPMQQKYAQAMRNFINAKLRDESGAAIAPSEFDSANKQYFAQLGDSPEVARQKKQNRMSVFSALKTEAGGAYDQVKTQSAIDMPQTESTGKRIGKYFVEEL